MGGYDTPTAMPNMGLDIHSMVKAFYDACKERCGFDDALTGELTNTYLGHLLSLISERPHGYGT